MNFITNILIGILVAVIIPIILGSILRLLTDEKNERYSIISVLILGWLVYVAIIMVGIVFVTLNLIGSTVTGK